MTSNNQTAAASNAKSSRIENLFNCEWPSIRRKMARFARGERSGGKLVCGNFRINIGGKDEPVTVWANGYKINSVCGKIHYPVVFATVGYDYGSTVKMDSMERVTKDEFDGAVCRCISEAITNYLTNNRL